MVNNFRLKISESKSFSVLFGVFLVMIEITFLSLLLSNTIIQESFIIKGEQSKRKQSSLSPSQQAHLIMSFKLYLEKLNAPPRGPTLDDIPQDVANVIVKWIRTWALIGQEEEERKKARM